MKGLHSRFDKQQNNVQFINKQRDVSIHIFKCPKHLNIHCRILLTPLLFHTARVSHPNIQIANVLSCIMNLTIITNWSKIGVFSIYIKVFYE